MYDPDQLTRDFKRQREIRANLSEFNKGVVFDALASANITKVLVEFDGEGDNGQIESITASRNGANTDLPPTAVLVQSVGWGATEPVTTEWSLAEAIETLCYDYLEYTHGGFENNDGGYGNFRFDVANRTVSLEMNERYIDIHTTNHTF